MRDIHFAMCHSRPISQTNPYVATNFFPYKNKNNFLAPLKIAESYPQAASFSNESNQISKIKHLHKHKSLIVTNRRHIQGSSKKASNIPCGEIEMLLHNNLASNFVKSNSVEFYDNLNMNMSDDYTYYYPCQQIKMNPNRPMHHTSEPLINYRIEHF
jgi:hypothetical protein